MLRLFLALLGALAVCGEDEDGASPGEAFDEIKCSACCSIVAELERNLETEKPRMNVDLRRTLAGQDKGKVVDYLVGLDDLGGVDDFKTETLALCLANKGGGMIQWDEGEDYGEGGGGAPQAPPAGRSVRSGQDFRAMKRTDSDEDSDFDD